MAPRAPEELNDGMGDADRPAGANDAIAEPRPPGNRRRTLYLVLAGVVIAVVAVVLVVFQPHKLFIDDKVDEALPPGVMPAAGGPAGGGTPAAEPGRGRSGAFTSRDHPTSGTAVVLSLQDGSRLLRLEDLDTDNGPDLRVYLSAAPATAAGSAFDDDFVDLGGLKGNIGSQNYTIAANVDVGRYRSVVIWCRRFSVAFGVAPLS